jgi:acetyltransferase-like isoleucine patch superfamily enzyme
MLLEKNTSNWIKRPPVNYKIYFNDDNEPFFKHDAALLSKNTIVGRYSYIHGNTRVSGNANLQIGAFCSIANNVTFHCGDEHQLGYVSTYPFQTILGMKFNYNDVHGDGIIIGNDVWIGEGARILSGSIIGDGSVIGAGSVVKKNLEPYSVCIGNPSRVLKKRFSHNIIHALLELKWWNWSIEKIHSNHVFFESDLEYITRSKFISLFKNIL